MEDFENSGDIQFGSGVLLTTKKGKEYMGVLEMIDTKFIHMKVTATTGILPIQVPQDQVNGLLVALGRRPMVALWVELARNKSVVVSRKMTKAQLVRLRATQIIEEAVRRAEETPKYALRTLPKATYTLIPHNNLGDIKSMEDIGSGMVLDQLDTPELDLIMARVYHGEHEADRGSDEGTDVPDEQEPVGEAEVDH